MPEVEAIVISLRGELDIFALAYVRETLAPALEAEGDAVIDLSAVTYLEAAAVGELLRVLRAKNAQRRRLALVVTARRVQRVFMLTELHGTFAIFPTVQSARMRFAATGGPSLNGE